jgi:recombination protein RecT
MTTPALNNPPKQELTIKGLFSQEIVKKKFQELLGSKMQGFVTSVLQCVASNDLLAKADPHSVYHAAAVAATLDLPLNNSLGMAYIVPYNVRQPDQTKKVMAQFQMGYKAFIQLAQRSGQFKTINATEVREGEIKHHDRLSGEITFEWIQGSERSKAPVVGFVAYFKLLNGFEKSLYMTSDEIKAHGQEYSQSFKKGFGLWKDKFEAMASKTVLKLLLSKYAPLSIAMQTAVIADQSIIKDPDTLDVDYVDNPAATIEPVNKEEERITLMIKDAKTAEDLEKLRPHITTDGQIELFADRREELTKKKK